MWDLPRYRIRTYAASLKRSREEQRQRRLNNPFHLKRTTVELRVSQGNALSFHTIPGRMLFTDLKQEGALVFSHEAVAVGTRVALTIQKPQTFFVRGKVVGSYLVSQDSKILSEHSYSYRVVIRFEYANEVERIAVSEYCKTLAHLSTTL